MESTFIRSFRGLFIGFFLLAVLSPWQVIAQYEIQTGKYTGDGVNNRTITGIGFKPDVVIIKSSGTQQACIRTSTMPGDNSKKMSSTAAFAANMIQSLDNDGFTVGSDQNVNKSGNEYYWVAMKAEAGLLMLSTYIGDGLDNRAITGVGFQPDLVMVIDSSGQGMVYRVSSMSGEATFRFNAGDLFNNRIKAFQADGFLLGTHSTVNNNGDNYHFLAMKIASGKMNVGSYVGDSLDNRSITGLTFQPEYAIIKAPKAQAVHRPSSIIGDTCLEFTSSKVRANMIQSYETDGFQVGNANETNKLGETYYWVAFANQNNTGIGDRADVRFILYPNPLSGTARIKITSNDLLAGLQIYDVDGKLVREETGLSGTEHMLHSDGLPAGMYFVRVITEGGAIYTDKLVVHY